MGYENDTHNNSNTVTVITFIHQVALVRRQRPLGRRVKVPPAHQTTTLGGGFTQSF